MQLTLLLAWAIEFMPVCVKLEKLIERTGTRPIVVEKFN